MQIKLSFRIMLSFRNAFIFNCDNSVTSVIMPLDFLIWTFNGGNGTISF